MLIVAHRGFSAAYPENTALAFERAIEAGAEVIETDVRFSADGALVCSHDPDLRRVAGDPRSITELTRAELKRIPLAKEQTLLELTEVLEIAKGRVRVMLDVKVGTASMAAAIAKLLNGTDATAEVVYGARSIDHAREILAHCPGVSVLGMPPKPELAETFIEAGARAIRYWEDEVTADRLESVHRAGREVWVTAGLRGRQEAPGYTTADRLIRLRQLAVDAVLVNDPCLSRPVSEPAA